MDVYHWQNRRDFIRYVLGTSALTLIGKDLQAGQFFKKEQVEKLTILYTNDVHSRIEPFPANDPKYPGQGGAAKRASIIKKIRSEEPNVLLLDAGDIFQGTPYFNYFLGELEFKLMTQMGYDASTLGNHDFDLGVDNLVKQMPYARFSFVNSNYDFKNTALAGKILPCKIIRKGGLKIGILGVGIELKGLVEKKNYGDVVYNNPVEKANKMAAFLKHDKKCDYVICLSHLGYKYGEKKISDAVMAAETQDIDLIIGGHTHTFLEQPVLLTNSQNKPVYVTQVGWAGIWLGRIDILFSSDKKNQSPTASVIPVHEHIG